MSLIYNSEQTRAWDAFTIKNEPIASIDLMERAAVACCKKILGSYAFNSITIVCGKGNNGGDGLAMARLFSERGIDVNVIICEYSTTSSADFDINLKRLPKNIKRTHYTKSNTVVFNSDLLIDCLFGSGLNRPVDNWIGELILKMNAVKYPIVSIDIPSGLFVYDNSKNDFKYCIEADLTLTFQVPKFSFFFAEYEKYIGHFFLISIGLSENFKGNHLAIYLNSHNLKLASFSNFSHKGTKGYLTVIAGAENMIGAAILCAKSAFKTGCGYVGVISNEKIITPLATVLPEAIWFAQAPEKLPLKTSAIAIGPGLGQSNKSLKLVELALHSNFPIVLDADALNLLVKHPHLLKSLPKNAILTPHIGELHRLIGTADCPENLLKKQALFSKKHTVFIIQKGAYSKLTTPTGEIFINSTGNSAMASAGMGDALTGIIGSFLAQGYAPLQAAKLGMYYHGLAGDIAIRKNGKQGLLTSDLIQYIPNALNGI